MELFYRYMNWLYKVTWWKKHEYVELYKIIDRLKPANIIDFGCNDGYLSSRVQQYTGAEVFAVDIDREALERGQRLRPNVRFVTPDALKVMQLQIDLIILSHVLEHVDSCEDVLGLLEPLLAPNGKFIIIVPQDRIRGDILPFHILYQSLKNKRFLNPHVRIIRRKVLEKLLSGHGLAIENYVYINLLPPLVSRAYNWLSAFCLITTCGRKS